jgi:hypothetical protein
MEANQRRIWLVRMVAAEARSANRSIDLGRLERGDDKARIGLALRPFRLADHPPWTVPVFRCLPVEVAEPAGWLAGRGAFGRGRREFGVDFHNQACVTCEAEEVIDSVSLAPGHQGIATKTGIRAE